MKSKIRLCSTATTRTSAGSYDVPIATPIIPLLALGIRNTCKPAVFRQFRLIVVDALNNLVSLAALPTAVFSLETDMVHDLRDERYTDVHQHKAMAKGIPWQVSSTILEWKTACR